MTDPAQVMIRTLIYGADSALSDAKQMHRRVRAPLRLAYAQGRIDSWQEVLTTLLAMQDRRPM